MLRIGLLAPFEGLYRRTGYAALAAMRAAIAETPTQNVDVLPLALDDGNDPQRARRAAQKLLTDASVRALVGPLNPATLWGVIDVLPVQPLVWTTPFAVAPDTDHFADPRRATDWASRLLASVAVMARRQQAQRLVLAGMTPGWPPYSARAWAAAIGMPVLVTDEVGAVTATDAVFWLGNPDGAATYLAKLRETRAATPFWLGPQGGDPVFVERVRSRGPVYWATWLGADYDQWATRHSPATPMAYLVYQATRQNIATMTGQSDAFAGLVWRVQMFVIDEKGESHPLPE